MKMKRWCGPTRQCQERDNCRGCVKCMRIAQLVESVRLLDSPVATELANRVDNGLLREDACKPGTVADWYRNRLEPVPSSALDAMEAASEAFGDKQETAQ